MKEFIKTMFLGLLMVALSYMNIMLCCNIPSMYESFTKANGIAAVAILFFIIFVLALVIFSVYLLGLAGRKVSNK